MKFLEYIGGTSGSSGNCHVLTLEAHNTVIILDCGVPFKFVKSLLDEVTFPIEQVVLAVTHQHQDHYNKATIKHIMNDFNTVLTGYDGLSKLSQPIVLIKKNDVKLFIVRQRFNHGEVDSYGFVIKAMHTETKELDKIGYITDIDMTNAPYFESQVCLFHDCDLLLLEANYAEMFYTDCFMNPDKYEQFGYDILGGFNRHLTREYSEQLAKNLNTKVYEPIHKSSRFYEWGQD